MQPRAVWLRKVGQAFIVWFMAATLLAMPGLAAHRAGGMPWHWAAYRGALTGFLVHFLFLYRRRLAGADIGSVVPPGVFVVPGVTLAFVATGPVVGVATLRLISGGGMEHLTWELALAGYDFGAIPAAIAGLADAAIVLALRKPLALGGRAAVGAAAGVLAYGLFGIVAARIDHFMTRGYFTEGIVLWGIPCVVAGAASGLLVNGLATRHMRPAA